MIQYLDSHSGGKLKTFQSFLDRGCPAKTIHCGVQELDASQSLSVEGRSEHFQEKEGVGGPAGSEAHLGVGREYGHPWKHVGGPAERKGL